MLTEHMKTAIDTIHGAPKSKAQLKNVDKRTLDALERLGYVRSSDRRTKTWSLTPSGIQIYNNQ